MKLQRTKQPYSQPARQSANELDDFMNEEESRVRKQ